MLTRRTQTWCCRPLSELASLSKLFSKKAIETQRVGSYVMLPNDFPLFISTGRIQKIMEELNDLWFSVTSGSEDFSFKHMRKNIFEEQLFKCEDERFECDVYLNCYTWLISQIESLLDEASKQP